MAGFPDELWINIFSCMALKDLFMHVRFTSKHFNHILSSLMHTFMISHPDITTQPLKRLKTEAIVHVFNTSSNDTLMRHALHNLDAHQRTVHTITSLMHAVPKMEMHSSWIALNVLYSWSVKCALIDCPNFDAHLHALLVGGKARTRDVSLAANRNMYGAVQLAFRNAGNKGDAVSLGRIYLRMLCDMPETEVAQYAADLPGVKMDRTCTWMILCLLPSLLEKNRALIHTLMQTINDNDMMRMPPIATMDALCELASAGIKVQARTVERVLVAQTVEQTHADKLTRQLRALFSDTLSSTCFFRILRGMTSHHFYLQAFKLVICMPRMDKEETTRMLKLLTWAIPACGNYIQHSDATISGKENMAHALTQLVGKYPRGNLEETVRCFMVLLPFECLPQQFIHEKFGPMFWVIYANKNKSNDVNMLYVRWLVNTNHPVTAMTLEGRGGQAVTSMHKAMMGLLENKIPAFVI